MTRNNCKDGCKAPFPLCVVYQVIAYEKSQVFYAYTYGTAGWMALQAAPLMISPTMIVTMLAPEVREASILEEYFSRSLGMALVALGVLTILLTGSVPLTSSFSDSKPGPFFLDRIYENRELTWHSNKRWRNDRSFRFESSLCCPNPYNHNDLSRCRGFPHLCPLELNWKHGLRSGLRIFRKYSCDGVMVYLVC